MKESASPALPPPQPDQPLLADADVGHVINEALDAARENLTYSDFARFQTRLRAAGLPLPQISEREFNSGRELVDQVVETTQRGKWSKENTFETIKATLYGFGGVAIEKMHGTDTEQLINAAAELGGSGIFVGVLTLVVAIIELVNSKR